MMFNIDQLKANSNTENINDLINHLDSITHHEYNPFQQNETRLNFIKNQAWTNITALDKLMNGENNDIALPGIRKAAVLWSCFVDENLGYIEVENLQNAIFKYIKELINNDDDLNNISDNSINQFIRQNLTINDSRIHRYETDLLKIFINDTFIYNNLIERTRIEYYDIMKDPESNDYEDFDDLNDLDNDALQDALKIEIIINYFINLVIHSMIDLIFGYHESENEEDSDDDDLNERFYEETDIHYIPPRINDGDNPINDEKVELINKESIECFICTDKKNEFIKCLTCKNELCRDCYDNLNGIYFKCPNCRTKF